MPRHRMHPGLVALSASAIAAIYVAGYVRTQPADAAIDAAPEPTAVVAAAAPTRASATPTVAVPQPAQRSIPTPPPAATAAPAPAAQRAATYKDGTYTGSGTSRRGDVWGS